MKPWKKINRKTGRRAAVLVFCLLLCWSSVLWAGGYPEASATDEQERVEVSLNGVNRFGAVQLFDYLLTKVPGVSAVQQTELRLVPDEPDACRAGWSVQGGDGDAAYLLQEMHTIIHDLDPEKQNDILYEAPFLVMKEDVEMIKTIIPVESVPGYAAFGVAGRVTADTAVVERRKIRPGLPWYAMPGAGFE